MRVNETIFVVLIGILWVVITVMGSTGLWFPALLLSVALIAHADNGEGGSGIAGGARDSAPAGTRWV